MSLEEPRPRGTVLGERADRLRVSEAENFFRCNICGGYLDAQDYVWIEDHEGPLPHAAGSSAVARDRIISACGGACRPRTTMMSNVASPWRAAMTLQPYAGWLWHH